MITLLFTGYTGATCGIVVVDTDGNIHRHACEHLSPYQHAYLLTPTGFADEPFWSADAHTVDSVREALACLDLPACNFMRG